MKSTLSKMHKIAAFNYQKLESDIACLEQLQFRRTFLEPVSSSNVYGVRASSFLKRLELDSSPVPSMMSIMQAAGEYFGIHPDSSSFINAQIAGNLGSIPTDDNVTFHSAPDHPRKVLLQTIRLISTHNELVKMNKIKAPLLDERDINLLMTAAAIHDFQHDGKGNFPAGQHEPYRLEDIAFNKFKKIMNPYFDEKDLEDLQILLKCTDVTSADGVFEENSPMMLLQRFYNGAVKAENLPQELSRLAEDKKLVLMALILTKADIATSAGLSTRRTLIESAFLAQETGMPNIATAAASVEFIQNSQLCKVLPAAEEVYGKNPECISRNLKKKPFSSRCYLTP